MDDIPLAYNLFLIFLLLFGSAFFCFAEGSLFSLGRHQKQSLFKENSRTSNVIQKLLSNPFKLIITILFADEVANVAFSSIVGLTVHQLLTEYSEKTVAIISIAIASPVLLLFGEIGPKTIAVKFPRIAAKAVSHPLNIFHILITPIRWVLMIISIGFTKLFVDDLNYQQHNSFSTDELKILVGIGNEEGVLNELENKLVSSFYKLENIPVYKIMTPNIDCFSLSSESKISEAIYEIKKRGYSRTPVYKDDVNNIIGILYSKDLLTSNDYGQNIDEKPITDYLKKTYFIPRTKMAFELLGEFQRNRIHMAIVVDEYGRVDGLVTMEDILEVLFGEIEDETQMDVKTEPKFIGNSLFLPGAMKIEDFNENYLFMVTRFGGLNRLGEILESSILPLEEEHETLGGFIFNLFGRFPVEEESIVFGGLKFTVQKIHKKRISELKIEVADEGVSDVA